MYSMKKMTIRQFKNYKLKDDEFGLYNLKVQAVHLDKRKPLICNHPVGAYFTLRGENFGLPKGQPFPVYGIASLLPLLPAKQRINHKNDWMETDAHVACPDPTCGGAFHIKRTSVSVFKNSEVTGAIDSLRSIYRKEKND